MSVRFDWQLGCASCSECACHVMEVCWGQAGGDMPRGSDWQAVIREHRAYAEGKGNGCSLTFICANYKDCGCGCCDDAWAFAMGPQP